MTAAILITLLVIAGYLFAGVLTVRAVIRFGPKDYQGHLRSGTFARSLEDDRVWAGLITLIWPAVIVCEIIGGFVLLLGHLAGVRR